MLQTTASLRFLFIRTRLVDRLLACREAFEFSQRLKELLDLTGRLVGMEDLSRDTYSRPHMLDIAGNEPGFRSVEMESLPPELWFDHILTVSATPTLASTVQTRIHYPNVPYATGARYGEPPVENSIV